MAKRGAKSIFENKQKLVAALKGIKGHEGYAEPSRYHKMQMAEQGLVQFEIIQTGTRGRPQHKAKLTSRGQAYVNFAK